MTIPAPMIFTWDGDAMVPKVPRLADRYYVVGEQYRLVVDEGRSGVSHRHFFAAIHEAFKNLPEELAERFPSDEHFRKHCLIMEGYRDERTFVAASKAEALRLAAFVKPMDEYAVVVVRECVVVVWTAKSQSTKAMGAKDFQASKQKVLDRAASMIGVSADALSANTSRAA